MRHLDRDDIDRIRIIAWVLMPSWTPISIEVNNHVFILREVVRVCMKANQEAISSDAFTLVQDNMSIGDQVYRIVLGVEESSSGLRRLAILKANDQGDDKQYFRDLFHLTSMTNPI